MLPAIEVLEDVQALRRKSEERYEKVVKSPKY